MTCALCLVLEVCVCLRVRVCVSTGREKERMLSLGAKKKRTKII